MATDRAIINFDSPRQKAMVLDAVKHAKGLCWFELARARNQRTLQQNSYYWGVVLKMVQAAIEEAWGEPMPADEVHEFLKYRFLRKPVTNHKTGEVVGAIPESSAKLDTKQMTDFIENVRMFAADTFGIDIPDPQ